MIQLQPHGLSAAAPMPIVSLTPTEFLQLLEMSKGTDQYPVILKIANNLGFQSSGLNGFDGLNGFFSNITTNPFTKFAPIPVNASPDKVLIALRNMRDALQNAGLGSPDFQPDGLGGYYDNFGNLYDVNGLNGFFSKIGSFIKRNVTSATKDVGRVVGQVVKIAGPIVSGITGIPIETIAGFTGKIGNMIGGDLGNMMSAISNNGESEQRQNERLIREAAWEQDDMNRKQAAADKAAQDAYNTQLQAQSNAAALIKARTPIGYTQNTMLAPVAAPVYNSNLPVYATPAQIQTIATVKNLPAVDVEEEVKKRMADLKALETPKTTLLTPTNIAIGVLGVAVLGGGIYVATKK